MLQTLVTVTGGLRMLSNFLCQVSTFVNAIQFEPAGTRNIMNGGGGGGGGGRLVGEMYTLILEPLTRVFITS